MIPEISTISFLIGVIAGIIFYLDGWRPSIDNQKLSESPRYGSLLVVIGGGVVSPIIDRFLLGTNRFEFFKGYLFGVVIGWLTLFIGITLLYVLWKNTEDLLPDRNCYKLGQISYSFIEIIYGGISVESFKHQQQIQKQLHEHKIEKLKQKLRQENPQQYVKSEDQIIQGKQYALKAQKENLEKLKIEINRADSEPEQEAEKLIQDKNKLIETLQTELELTRNYHDEDRKRTQKIVDLYSKQLCQQEDEIRELQELIKQFKNQTISQLEFSKLISFKRINQYEFGGVFIGELAIYGKLIKIYQGDITNLVTDVIVSSDDNYLTMGGGVSYTIRSIGGNNIYTEAQKLVPLSLGEVAVTTAGKLSAQKVFHGVVIDFDSEKGPSRKVIQKVVHTCIKKANEANYRSIAFPLFGAGTGGFSAVQALQVILSQTIKDLSDQTQSLVEIIIVIYGRVAELIDVEAVIREVKDSIVDTPTRF